jgi:hypothetical protein
MRTEMNYSPYEMSKGTSEKKKVVDRFLRITKHTFLTIMTIPFVRLCFVSIIFV